VRGFFLGLILVVGISVTILSLRPGGFRRQLRMAGRRLRIFLWLGAIYVAGSTVVNVAYPSGPVADYGPPALAIALAVVFIVIAQDPATTAPGSSPPSRAP